MSSLIVEGIDRVFTPSNEFAETWHKMNECVDGLIALDGSNVCPVFVPIVESKFTLKDVDASKLLKGKFGDDDDDNESATALDKWKMILAQHDKGLIPLHVPKSGYQIHQNKDLFKSFVGAAKTVLGEGNFEIATIGTLGACSQFFVSVSIKGQDSFKIGKGKKADLQKLFFNLVSSHNGIVASSIMLSIVRIVCMNTVMASLSDAEANGRQTKFKHTAQSLAMVTPESFAKSLKAWTEAADSYKRNLESFITVPMSLDGFRSFATGVFTNEGSDSLSTTSFNRVTDMESLFAKGRGNNGESLYDGINAFTEYFTSGRGVGGKNVDAGKRVASANFGRGNDWKRTAIGLASTEESLKATLARGERLYGDKLKADAAEAAAN